MTDGRSAASRIGAQLFVDADLHIEVDGVPAHVTGDGRELRVTTPQPVRFLRVVARSRPPGFGSLRPVLAELRSAGLSVRVDGPRGTLARYSDGRVSLGRPRSLIAASAAAIGAVLGAVVVRRLLRR
ncbi:hypothetical protein [Jatrophihabitans fulvus]